MTPKQISPDRYDCAGLGAAELATWLRERFEADTSMIWLVLDNWAHAVYEDDYRDIARGLLIAAELEESRTL